MVNVQPIATDVRGLRLLVKDIIFLHLVDIPTGFVVGFQMMLIMTP